MALNVLEDKEISTLANKTKPHIALLYTVQYVLVCGVAYNSSSTSTPKAWFLLGDREDQINQRRRRRKVFNTNPYKQRQRDEPWHWLHNVPVQFALFQLPAPAIRRGATGGHIGATFAPMAPFLATAFKVLHCDVHGLDVCLVPYMQSYHYPCLLTIAGPVFVTSAALCLGLWHDCTVDLFSFTYRSLCLPFPRLFCTQTVYRVWIQLIWWLGTSFTSQPVWHLCCFHVFARFTDNSQCSRAIMCIDVRHTLSRRFALCSGVFHIVYLGVAWSQSHNHNDSVKQE